MFYSLSIVPDKSDVLKWLSLQLYNLILGYEDLFSLNGQIQHKSAFIEDFLPSSCNITFIGHSIGCKIILEVMKKLNFKQKHNENTPTTNNQVLNANKSYLLFPAIERIKQLPAGRFTWIQVEYKIRSAHFYYFHLKWCSEK